MEGIYLIFQSIEGIIQLAVLGSFSLLFSYTDITSRKIRNKHLILFAFLAPITLGKIHTYYFIIGSIFGFVLFSVGGFGAGDGKLLMVYSLWGLHPLALLLISTISSSPLIYYFYKKEEENEDFESPWAPILSIGAIILFVAG